MAALSPFLRNSENNGLTFWCPGCNQAHGIRHGLPPNGWHWNGDAYKPVFSPSVLVRCGHYASAWKPGDECWCTYNAEQKAKGEEDPDPFVCYICHSFVGSSDGSTPGKIQFLNDCTHALAGKTVDLPAWPIREE